MQWPENAATTLKMIGWNVNIQRYSSSLQVSLHLSLLQAAVPLLL